ncbi:MAG: alpha/beta hydrolase [marine benthic group bacterium]|nr:alpha/beta hydrolase [Gemmatimonadota bacterium]
MRPSMTLLAIVAGAYILICAVAYVLQPQMVFFPDRTLVATPAAIGLAFEAVEIDTEDGERLHGWFVPGEGGRVLLFFHGNAGNISHRLDSIRDFHELGLSVLILDYRGYGRSTGRMSEEGSYVDARAAFRHLRDVMGYEARQIVLFGRSLGSAVAIELATHVQPGALIAESCFTSIPDVGARHYRLLPVRMLARIQYDSLSRVPQIQCPKLFVHSRRDETIPFDMGRRVFEAAADPKTFLEIDGGHNAGARQKGAGYLDGLAEFLDSVD